VEHVLKHVERVLKHVECVLKHVECVLKHVECVLMVRNIRFYISKRTSIQGTSGKR
jgi:hypothetical protein